MPPTENTALDGNALFRRISFVTEVACRVKSLSGWKKTHRIPDPTDARAQEYIADISAADVKQDLDAVYTALQQAFGFKRRELSVAEPADGTGTIATPFFSYSVSIAMNPADPTEAIWIKTVDSILEPKQIVSAPFAQVFDGVFRTLRFSLPTPVNINDCIDTIEDAEIRDLQVSYDREGTFCELRFAGASAVIRITADFISIVENRPAEVGALIQSLKALQTLVREHHVPLNWAD
jgi:hypothetical protein